jgi:hypothetical protein
MQRDVVERAMAGDHEAFSDVARLSIGRLYAVSRLILRDDDRAQDALGGSVALDTSSISVLSSDRGTPVIVHWNSQQSTMWHMGSAPDSTSPMMPGADLVTIGLADLAAGRETVEAMLVSCARARLLRLGYVLATDAVESPERRLYALVEAQVGPERAHSRYNALRRRLVSFLESSGHAPTG